MANRRAQKTTTEGKTQFACRNSQGFIRAVDTTTGRMSSKPMLCADRYCEPCREKETNQITAGLIDTAYRNGWTRQNSWDLWMLTLTLPAGKRKDETWGAFMSRENFPARKVRRSVRWELAKAWQTLEEEPEDREWETAEIAGEALTYSQNVAYRPTAQERRKVGFQILREALDEYGDGWTSDGQPNTLYGWRPKSTHRNRLTIGITLRAIAQYHPEMHRDIIGGWWTEFRRRATLTLGGIMGWEKETPWIRSWEFTEQGIPHIHTGVMQQGSAWKRFESQAMRIWHDMTGATQVMVSDPSRFEGQGMAGKVAYIMKYVCKLQKNRDPWRSISYRRFGSGNWERPTRGEAITYETRAQNGSKTRRNKAQYKGLRQTMRQRVLAGTITKWEKLTEYVEARRQFVEQRVKQGFSPTGDWTDRLCPSYIIQWRDGHTIEEFTGDLPLLSDQFEPLFGEARSYQTPTATGEIRAETPLRYNHVSSKTPDEGLTEYLHELAQQQVDAIRERFGFWSYDQEQAMAEYHAEKKGKVWGQPAFAL